MTLPALVNPFQPFIGLAGTGLNQGALYVGLAGMDPQTNPQDCFWDAAGTIPATQPIPIVGGYTMYLGSPAQLFTADTYSLRLRDKPGGVQVFYLATGSPPTGKANVDFSNVTDGVIVGDFSVVGATDPVLFAVDYAADQVSIGEAPVNPYRKLWVNNTKSDMTVAGQITGHDAIASRMACTGFGTAAINPNGVYGTLWYWPQANAHFTGDGAAVRGNVYTINVPGVRADVDLLIGVYGRARHESVLGAVNVACSFFADGAQKGAGGGIITNACALYVQGNTQGNLNYGVYFETSPSNGCIAMATGQPFTVSVGLVNALQLHADGNMVLTRSGPTDQVLFEVLNASAGAAAGAAIELATGTSGSTATISLQDNAGAPYFLTSVGGAVQGFFWQAPLTAWRDNSAVEYGRVTAGTLNHLASFSVAGTQVVGARGAAVADATGPGDVVAQLNALLARCRAHGLIAP